MIHNGERTVSSLSGAEKPAQPPAENETAPRSYTTHKTQLKANEGLEREAWKQKTPTRKHKQ